MKLSVTRYVCYNAIIACVYLALVYIFQFMSFGAVQFRIAEAMTILPSLFPFSVAGLTIGCLLSNFMSVWGWSDLVFGTLCTLIAGLITSRIKNPFLAALPPVLINAFGLPPLTSQTAFGGQLPYKGSLVQPVVRFGIPILV